MRIAGIAVGTVGTVVFVNGGSLPVTLQAFTVE
jgi:hypothetical protein